MLEDTLRLAPSPPPHQPIRKDAMEEYIAHGICMNRSCGYSGDMTWFNEGEDEDTAVCPECGERTRWDMMADTAEQRDAIWRDQAPSTEDQVSRLDDILKRLKGDEDGDEDGNGDEMGEGE